MSAHTPTTAQPLRFALILQAILLVLMGCNRPEPTDRKETPTPMTVTVTSKAFAPGEAIPGKYTGEGDDISPPLGWSGVPDETRELVVICDDPDAPRPDPWVHWVIYGISPDVNTLPPGVDRSPRPPVPPGAVQGINSWGKVGYMGPMPPPGHGTHHYHFKLYALDAELNLAAGLDEEALQAAITGHVLARGELVGTYERK